MTPTTKKIFAKIILFSLLLLIIGQNSFAQNTYYTYKDIHEWSGDWHHQYTWTSSPNGEDITTPSVSPQDGDHLIIVENTTVKLLGPVTTANLSIEIQPGASLIVGTHEFTYGLAALTGQGTIIIENNYYPTIHGNHSFAEHNGGSVIMNLNTNDSLLFPSSLHQANHLNIVALNNANFFLGLEHPLQINGNLALKTQATSSYTFAIGNEVTTLDIHIKGNLLIEEEVSFGVAPYNKIHNINLEGNLHVDGKLKLSNSSQYNEASNGAAIFTFTGNKNTSITGNGQQLDFYRLILDKGLDQTFILDVHHVKFALFGPTNLSNSNSDSNPVINKALWIKNGTLRLRTGIVIEQLSSGGNDIFIPLNGALWVDGAEVHSTTPVGDSGNTGITLIGTLRISAGKVLTNKAAGIVYRGTSLLIIEGGELSISQFRPSSAEGNHQASWIQYGGIANITGNGENNTSHPRFSLPLSSHSFIMTGGELNLHKPNQNNQGLAIGAAQGNIHVSGGTVNLYIPSTRDFGFSSTAPFYNLNVYSDSDSRQLVSDISYSFEGVTLNPQKLIIINDLQLHSNAIFNAKGHDLNIGGDLKIMQGAEYITGLNTTTFFYDYIDNLDFGKKFVNIWIHQDYTLELHNVIFDKKNGGSGDGGNITFENTNPRVNSFVLISNGKVEHYNHRARVIFNGFHFSVKGDVFVQKFSGNSAPRWVDTKVYFNGTNWQELDMPNLRADNHNDPLNYYVLDNPVGIQLKADFSAMNLEIKQGVFDIGAHELYLYNPIHGTGFTADKMVRTNGLSGDKGLKLRLQGVNAGDSPQLVFPIGTVNKYTPMTLMLSGTGSVAGSTFVSVSPVNTHHPSSNKTDSVLHYYWKTDASFSSLSEDITVGYKFDFIYSDLAPDIDNQAILLNEITIDETVEVVWQHTGNSLQHVYGGENNLLFPDKGFLSTFFTAGKQGAHENGYGIAIFESVKSGNWNDFETWGKDSADVLLVPNANSIVRIHSDHTVTINQNNANALYVNLERNNGTLDIGNTTGHVFENITGDGTLRLASPHFPQNNAGNYNNIKNFVEINQATIEYYGTEQDYTLSHEILTYHHLHFSENAVKTLPAGDLEINGNLKIEGSTNSNNQPTSQTHVRTNPLVPGTIIINGEFQLPGTAGDYNSGKKSVFIFSDGSPWKVITNGYLKSQNRGSIIVEKNAVSQVNHTLHVMSGMEGRGKLDLYGDGTVTADLIIKGGGNSNIGGLHSSNSWKLNRLVIDKTNSDNSVSINLPFTIHGSTHGDSKALELKTGSFIMGQVTKDITLTSGGSNFQIPTTASLIVEGENIIRTTGNSGLALNGSLILRDDAKALLDGATTHIVYGTSGSALIEIHNNAQLRVSGQIRRSDENPGSTLRYRQTGTSRVVVGQGIPNVTNRATFEILNIGSEFVLDTDATLTIANASSISFPALFIEPQTGSCKGDILIGNDSTKVNQQMGIRTNIPMAKVTVNSHNAPLTYLHTRNLLLTENLSIANDAVFQTRGLDMEIKGNLFNDGVFEAQGSETLLFTGTSHTIAGSGTTVFHNLTTDAVTGLTTNKTINTTGNLQLVRGVLNDGGNLITIAGDLTNNGIHVSPVSQGGILLTGNINQQIMGQGAFGRFTLDKSDQSVATVFGNITINNILTLKDGILNMGHYRLNIMENATITTGDPLLAFEHSRMIRLGGNIGDGGVRKYFSATDIASENFIFPIGIESFYTGMEIVEMTSFEAGKMINVYAVNSNHPTIISGVIDSDPNRVLQFYWGVESDFSNTETFEGKLIFHFHNSHVKGELNQYYIAQLRPAQDDSWAKLDEGIDQLNHTLTFNHPSVNANIFNGFYTAGEDDAIPNNIPRFKVGLSGNWETTSIWETGELPPSGVVVEIPQGFSVTITENMKRVYKTIINGHLIVEPGTTFHNLGIVEGLGSLELKGTGENNPMNLPTGRYENFMQSGINSTMIFSGSGGLLPASRNIYNNLTLAGTGQKTLPLASNISIGGLLSIEDGVTMVTRNDQIIEISGHLTITENASLIAQETNSHFILNGTQPQNITGNFTSNTTGGANNAIYRLRIDNPHSVQIIGTGLEITNNLYIDNGTLISRNSNLIISNPEADAIANYSKTNYIDGPLTRSIPATASEKFVFPVSHNHKPHFMDLETNSSAPGFWTVEYFDKNPNEDGMTTSSMEEPIQKVSQEEYWKVTGPENGRAFVSLNWGPTSAISQETGDLNSLLVAEWNNLNSVWESKELTNYEVQSDGYGFIRSNVVNFSTKYFTLASSDAENPLPIELLSFTAHLEKEAVLLKWVTASETNNNYFSLERSNNGKDFEVIATFPSKAENGFSNNLLHYAEYDTAPLGGMSYYRLKQTDYDGSFEYSNWVAVQYHEQFDVAFNLFPNPSNGRDFHIALSGLPTLVQLELTIIDLFGKQVYTDFLNTDENGNLMRPIITQRNLNPGIYLVTVSGNSGRYTLRMVVQ